MLQEEEEEAKEEEEAGTFFHCLYRCCCMQFWHLIQSIWNVLFQPLNLFGRASTSVSKNLRIPKKSFLRWVGVDVADDFLGSSKEAHKNFSQLPTELKGSGTMLKNPQESPTKKKK